MVVDRVVVELTVDLARYHPGLVVGARGVVIPNPPWGTWAHASDRFVYVDFHAPIGSWSILWTGLRVIEGLD